MTWEIGLSIIKKHEMVRTPKYANIRSLCKEPTRLVHGGRRCERFYRSSNLIMEAQLALPNNYEHAHATADQQYAWEASMNLSAI